MSSAPAGHALPHSNAAPGGDGVDLRQALRAATAAAHASLEATELAQAVAEGVPDTATYTGYLVAQWQLHAALEPLLKRHLAWLAAEGRASKAQWLEADLAALGWHGQVAPITVPRIRDADDALGAAYVLEGATLGIGVVRRRLPPEHPALGAAGRFFAAYGDQTGQHWRDFLRRLAEVPIARHANVCAAAVGTFAAFRAAFEQSAPCRTAAL